MALRLMIAQQFSAVKKRIMEVSELYKNMNKNIFLK